MSCNRLLALCMSPDKGGLELYFLKFINYYSTSELSKLYVACSRNSFISKNISKNKLECNQYRFLKNFINFFTIRKFIKENDIDTIHVSWGKDILLAVLLKILSRRKIIIIFYRQMKLSRSKKDLYHTFIYSNIDFFLVITKKLYEEACMYLPIDKSRIHILPYGIKKPSKESIINKDDFYKKNNMTLSTFSIGVFSRIEEQKGQHLVLKAINQSSHKIQLFIIGHVMDHEYKNNLIKDINTHNLADKVCFIDFLESPMSYMPCFDLIILPTYEETFGLIVAESMLMKVPIIGSNAGGVPEIINHRINGLLFETKNHDDLQNKIEFIIENPEDRKKIIDNGVKFANQRYDYKSHFLKLENIINMRSN